MYFIPLSTTFFQQPTLTVAPELLGKYLTRQMPDGDVVALLMLRQAQHKFEKWKLTMDFAIALLVSSNRLPVIDDGKAGVFFYKSLINFNMQIF